MRKILLVFTTLVFSSAAFAGNPPAPDATGQAPVSTAATSACSFTFTSGTNNTFLQFCVTANGNITQLATPFAREHIAVGTIGEGYGICDNTTSTGYFDYADFGDSGNWGPATVVSVSSSSVKIQHDQRRHLYPHSNHLSARGKPSRTSADGAQKQQQHRPPRVLYALRGCRCKWHFE